MPEAEAYAAFMGANVHLEREEWSPAREGFARCRTICVELCRVSMAEQVHLYRTMVDGVEPSIRSNNPCPCRLSSCQPPTYLRGRYKPLLPPI